MIPTADQITAAYDQLSELEFDTIEAFGVEEKAISLARLYRLSPEASKLFTELAQLVIVGAMTEANLQAVLSQNGLPGGVAGELMHEFRDLVISPIQTEIERKKAERVSIDMVDPEIAMEPEKEEQTEHEKSISPQVTKEVLQKEQIEIEEKKTVDYKPFKSEKREDILDSLEHPPKSEPVVFVQKPEPVKPQITSIPLKPLPEVVTKQSEPVKERPPMHVVSSDALVYPKEQQPVKPPVVPPTSIPIPPKQEVKPDLMAEQISVQKEEINLLRAIKEELIALKRTVMKSTGQAKPEMHVSTLKPLAVVTKTVPAKPLIVVKPTPQPQKPVVKAAPLPQAINFAKEKVEPKPIEVEVKDFFQVPDKSRPIPTKPHPFTIAPVALESIMAFKKNVASQPQAPVAQKPIVSEAPKPEQLKTVISTQVKIEQPVAPKEQPVLIQTIKPALQQKVSPVPKPFTPEKKQEEGRPVPITKTVTPTSQQSSQQPVAKPQAAVQMPRKDTFGPIKVVMPPEAMVRRLVAAPTVAPKTQVQSVPKKIEVKTVVEKREVPPVQNKAIETNPPREQKVDPVPRTPKPEPAEKPKPKAPELHTIPKVSIVDVEHATPTAEVLPPNPLDDPEVLKKAQEHLREVAHKHQNAFVSQKLFTTFTLQKKKEVSSIPGKQQNVILDPYKEKA